MRARLLVWFLGLGLPACAGGPGANDDAAGSSTGEPPRPTPAFIDPAGDELRIPVTRFRDLEVDVSQVRPGITAVVVDGVSIGTLPLGSRVGDLDERRLRLRLTGALRAGQHTLELVTPAGVDARASDPLTVVITPEPSAGWTWDLDAEVLAEGEGLIATGQGERGALVLVDDGHVDGSPTTITIWPAQGTGWERGRHRQLPLPGHRPALGERVAALDVARVGTGDDERLRVAWRVDVPGRRAVVVDVAWQGQLPRGDHTIVDIASQWASGVEYAEVVRPVVLGDVVLVEVIAAVDVEQARPGDRRILAARLDPAGELVATQPFQLGVVDSGSLAPVLDTLAPADAGGAIASFILGEQRLGLVEVDPAKSTMSLAGASGIPTDERVAHTVDGFATVIGALGSRTAAAATDDLQAVLLAGIDDLSATVEIQALELPEGDPIAAPLSAGVIAGIPVFLAPRGASDVVLVAVRSSEPEVVALEGLACDQIVVPRTAAGNDAGTLAFACLQAGALRVGTVAPVPQ